VSRKAWQSFAVFALAIHSAACAWTPPHIEAVAVSPARYAAQACEQLTAQLRKTTAEANALYQGFVERRKANSWKVTAAIIIFSPILLLLEGDDEMEVEQYAVLKGEYQALRSSAGQKRCEIDAVLLEEKLALAAAQDTSP